MGPELFKKVAAVAHLKKSQLKPADKTSYTSDHKPFILDGKLNLHVVSRTDNVDPSLPQDGRPGLTVVVGGACRKLGIVSYHSEVTLQWSTSILPLSISFLLLEVLVSNNLLTCPPVSPHLPALLLISFCQTYPLSLFNLHLVHLTIVSSLSLCLSICNRHLQPFQRQICLYKNTDVGELNSALENSLPPPEILSGGDIGSTWPKFRQALMSMVHIFVPSKKFTLDVSSNLGLLRRLGSYWRSETWPNSGQSARILPQLGSHFINFVTLLSLPFRGGGAKQEFFAKITSKARCSQDFWKLYHSITKSTSHLPSKLVFGNTRSSIASTKVEMFSNFLCPVSIQLTLTLAFQKALFPDLLSNSALLSIQIKMCFTSLDCYILLLPLVQIILLLHHIFLVFLIPSSPRVRFRLNGRFPGSLPPTIRWPFPCHQLSSYLPPVFSWEVVRMPYSYGPNGLCLAELFIFRFAVWF